MIILELVGLRDKMYSMLLENEDSKSAFKLVNKVAAKQELTHEMVKQFLMGNFEMTHKMIKMGHTHHQL